MHNYKVKFFIDINDSSKIQNWLNDNKNITIISAGFSPATEKMHCVYQILYYENKVLDKQDSIFDGIM